MMKEEEKKQTIQKQKQYKKKTKNESGERCDLFTTTTTDKVANDKKSA